MFDKLVKDDYKSITNSPSPRARYNLASASTRIGTRIIDIILSSLICVVLACVVLLTDEGFNGDFKNFIITQPWRYFIFGILCFITNITYFLFVPYKFNGQTIAMKLFKLATINLIFTHWFTNLIKKEFLLWILISFVSLVLSLTLFLIGQFDSPTAANLFIRGLINFSYSSATYTEVIAAFCSFYGVCGLILVAILFSVVLNNKHLAIHDKISNTTVVKLIDVSGNDTNNNNLNKKKKQATRNYKLPAGIIDSINDEIDSI